MKCKISTNVKKEIKEDTHDNHMPTCLHLTHNSKSVGVVFYGQRTNIPLYNAKKRIKHRVVMVIWTLIDS